MLLGIPMTEDSSARVMPLPPRRAHFRVVHSGGRLALEQEPDRRLHLCTPVCGLWINDPEQAESLQQRDYSDGHLGGLHVCPKLSLRDASLNHVLHDRAIAGEIAA